MELLAVHGLVCYTTAATLHLGGTLDIVSMHDNLPLSVINVIYVINVGTCVSDHRLLRWSASMARPLPDYTSMTTQPWRKLDSATFCETLSSSLLCRPDSWSSRDVD
jgi:hypothetical protein